MTAAQEAMERQDVLTRASMADLVQMTKPGIVLMALLAALLGYALGSSGQLDPIALILAALGIGLVGAGGNVLNMVMEKEADARMKRTRGRPLPAGRVSMRDAVLFGLSLTAAGWLILLVGVDHLTGLLAAFTFASYLFLYTPLKELTAFCTVVGAVPGAMPPVLGWTAAAGNLGWEALILFGILFFWQFPHFLPLAWIHREDYERGGFRMLSLGDDDGRRTARASFWTCLPLIAVTLTPGLLGMTGLLYSGVALLLGIGFLGFALRFLRRRDDDSARGLFFYSLAYLPALLGVLVLDALAGWF